MRLNLFTCPALVLFLISWLCLGQQLSKRITNQEVIEMVSLGLSDDVIIDKIHTTEETNFDTSLAGLKALKSAKVSDAVIRAMINPHPSAVGTAKGVVGAIEEVGVYILIKGKLTEIEPEIVNWQTGGVVKTHATLWIVKGDLNGRVMRSKSPTQVRSPIELLIKTPEGTSVEEYQLLRLHEKSNRREFRAVTGGVLHVSGGAERDEVEFQPEKIGTRTWRIKLRDFRNGEYGFLPPGVSSSSISASGKMYTFGVIDGDRVTQMPQSLSQDHGSVQGPVTSNEDEALPKTRGDGSIGVSSDENPTVRHDGVTVSLVTAGGPANQAGIQAGDAILAIDDHYLFTVQELNQDIRRRKPSTRIAIRYRRHSTIYDTHLIVGHAE